MNNKILLVFIGFIALVGCSKQPTFVVSGTIQGIEQQTIYLEHTALLGTTLVDSCQAKKDGTFKLKSQTPTHPDFYTLRVGKATLPLAIDSTEHITINTSIDSLPYTLNITGSEQSLQIAQIRSVARTSSREELRQLTKQIIIANPRSLAAYYAVFIKQNGQPVWNMADKADRRLYQAVATSFDLWMPDYERSKVLHNQILEQMQAERALSNQQAVQEFIEKAENAFLDITLPNTKGKMQSLSKYLGKVIILDFSAPEMEQFVAYNLELRELYNQYHQQGLEIYSVAVNRNKFAWEDAVTNLPWTTVRADENIAPSVLMQYNVQSIPTLFLIDRKGNIQGRYNSFKPLETDLRKYL